MCDVKEYDCNKEKLPGSAFFLGWCKLEYPIPSRRGMPCIPTKDDAKEEKYSCSLESNTLSFNGVYTLNAQQRCQ